MTSPFALVRRLALGLAWFAFATAAVGVSTASAHDESFPISGAKLTVKTNGDKADRKFVFDAVGEDVIRVANHDPSLDGAQIVVVGLGKKGGSSGLIDLPASNWSEILDADDAFKGYLYKDPSGSNSGITKVVLKNKTLRVKAKGKKWKWRPAGKQQAVWVQFFFEQEQYCAAFDDGSGADVMDNEKGLFRARDASAPGACLEQLCGNGRLEPGEECDDGNSEKKDGCRNDCTIGKCKGESYDSTYEAIQNVVFDSAVYRCTNDACHGAAKEGNLDLRAGVSYDQLINVPSDTNPDIARVFPGDPELSLLYEKVLAKAQERPASNGSSMPVAAPALADEHLLGLREWIRNAAPRDAVVIGTQDEFGTCLPPADPLKIDPPPRPESGVQFRQTAWPLPARSEDSQGEDEICMATLYDFTGTDIVPEESLVECGDQFERVSRCIEGGAWQPDKPCESDDDCADSGGCFTRNIINTTNECFAWDRQTLYQDPQSHHSIIFLYSGIFDDASHQWGPWTYKFDEPDDPRNGTTCDPTDVDPELGYHPGCSGKIVSTIACNVYGPPDATQLSLGGGGGTMPQFSGSQEPFYELGYPGGVYSPLPMRGMIVWNSHAFNLTQQDTTMSQYLNLDFAPPEDQVNPSIQLFDAQWIFSQYVKPFETQEICGTTTFPKGTRLFQLSSHTHRWGTNFRIWEPPNTPCRPACPPPVEGAIFGGCIQQGEYRGGDGLLYQDLPICDETPSEDPIYVSTDYSDPLNFTLPEIVELDSEEIDDRTYHFCSLYDNGSTPDSPSVKRYSTSPVPPSPVPIFEITGIGGPCALEERACMDGPNKGELCDGTDEESFCETSTGAGDGECDACPVRGGVTTEDEMYIHLGNYYIEAEEDD